MINYEGLQKHREQTKKDILKLLEINDRVACVRPTGYGKSHLIAQLCNELSGNKLVLEPGLAIINYMEKFGIDTPNTSYITYHSLLNPKIEDLIEEFKKYDYIFLDEMHRALAEKWGKKLKQVLEKLDNAKILGFSATPIRSDNRDSIEEIFGGCQIEPYYLEDAILDEYLPMIDYHSSIYEITDKQKKILKLKDTPIANQILNYDIDEGVSNIFKENLDLSKPHKIICFVDKISNINEAINNIKKWFKVPINIYKVHSKQSKVINDEQLNKFQNNSGLNIIFAVNILNEGVHLSGVDCVIFLRKTSSNILYNQQLGRVIADYSNEPIVFDLVNNIDNLNNSYSAIFSNKANRLGVKTERLVTKNGKHLKITVHQIDLIEKLISVSKYDDKSYTKEEIDFIKSHSEMTIRQLRDYINNNYNTNRSIQSVREFCKKNGYTYKSVLNRITDEQKDFIKNHSEMTNLELSNILNISSATISSYRHTHLNRNTRTYLTDKQKELIRNNSYKYTLDDMINIFGLTVSKCTLRVFINKNKLSYIRCNTIKFTVDSLTEEEKELIKKYYSEGISKKEISRILHHKTEVIKEYINIIGLQRNSRIFSIEQEEFIKNNAYRYTAKELSKILNCNIDIIYRFCTNHNIKFKKVNINKGPLSIEEKEFIKNNCNTMTNAEIGLKLNRSASTISHYARKYRKLKLCDILTDYQKEYINLHYNLQDMSQREIANHIGLSYNNVTHYIRAYIRNNK